MLNNSIIIWLHTLKNKIEKWISYQVQFYQECFIYQVSIHAKSVINVYPVNSLLPMGELLTVFCNELLINNDNHDYQ